MRDILRGAMRRPIQLALLAAVATLPSRLEAQGDAPLARDVADINAVAPASLAEAASLGDTTLARLIERALGGNRDLRAAAARVDEARASRTQAALDLVPSVAAVAGYTRQRLPMAAVPGSVDRLPARDYWDTGVEGAWEIDLFGRLRHGVQARSALIDASEADERDVQVLVTTELSSTYMELRGLQDRLAVATRNAENQRRTLELTQQRLDAGRGTAFDTERARAQLATTLAAMPVLESGIAAAQQRVAVLAGLDPAAVPPGLDTAAALPPLPPAPELGRLEPIILRRGDIVSAARRYAAESAFHGAAKAEYLPRITLVGGIGMGAGDFDRLGGRGTSRFSVGPVISWPLFNLGRVHAAADAAAARKAEAESAYEQSLLRAAAEIRTTHARYRSARARLEHLEEAAGASGRAAELARLRFEAGAADFLQVLDADRTLLAAHDQLAQGRADAATAYVALFKALGGNWP